MTRSDPPDPTDPTTRLLMAARLWWAGGFVLLAVLAVLQCRTVHGAPAADADQARPFQPATSHGAASASSDLYYTKLVKAEKGTL